MKRKGMIMIELLLVFGILTGLSAFYYTNIYRPSILTASQKNENLKMIEMEAFLKSYIIAAAEYNESQYSVTTNPPVAVNLVQLEPINPLLNSGATFLLDPHVLNYKTMLTQNLSKMNCLGIAKKTGGVDMMEYTCSSTTGGIYEMNAIYSAGAVTRVAGAVNNDIYNLVTPIIEMRRIDDNNVVVGGVKRPSIDGIYKQLRERSEERSRIIRTRLANFAKTIYIEEINNPCSVNGGLDSWDDSNIPWVWRVNTSVTNNPVSTRCGIAPAMPDATCGCATLAANAEWSNLNTGLILDSIDSSPDFVNMLSNLNLSGDFLSDAVGNPFRVILFSDGNGGSSIPNSPNIPSVNYMVNANAAGNLAVKQGEVSALDSSANRIARSIALFFYE